MIFSSCFVPPMGSRVGTRGERGSAADDAGHVASQCTETVFPREGKYETETVGLGVDFRDRPEGYLLELLPQE
jgi:hypothetical protein